MKAYLKSTTRNNRLHALILVHVHKNILDNINLADLANEYVNRNSGKQTSDIFLKINHNICKIKGIVMQI